MPLEKRTAVVYLIITAGFALFSLWLLLTRGPGAITYVREGSLTNTSFVIGLKIALALWIINILYHKILGRFTSYSRDERDLGILRKSRVTAGIASYIVFTLSLVCTWFIPLANGTDTISVHLLMGILLAGVLAFAVTQAISTIVLYNRG